MNKDVLVFVFVSLLCLISCSDDGVNQEYVENTVPTLSAVSVVTTAESDGYMDLESMAFDVDGDTLSYIWACGDGAIRSTGSAYARWFFPADSGEYSISVKAIDHRGGSVLATATVTRPTGVVRIVDIVAERGQ